MTPLLSFANLWCLLDGPSIQQRFRQSGAKDNKTIFRWWWKYQRIIVHSFSRLLTRLGSWLKSQLKVNVYNLIKCAIEKLDRNARTERVFCYCAVFRSSYTTKHMNLYNLWGFFSPTFVLTILKCLSKHLAVATVRNKQLSTVVHLLCTNAKGNFHIIRVFR